MNVFFLCSFYIACLINWKVERVNLAFTHLGLMRAKNKKDLLIYFYYMIMSSAYLHGVIIFTVRLTKYYFSNALYWRMRFLIKFMVDVLLSLSSY